MSDLDEESIFGKESKSKPHLQAEMRNGTSSGTPIQEIESASKQKSRNKMTLLSTQGRTQSLGGVLLEKKDQSCSINETPRKSPRRKKQNSSKEMHFLYEVIEEREEEEMLERGKHILGVEWLQRALETASFDWKRNEKLVCILLDLLLYEDSDLVHRAFELLFRLFSRHNRLA